MNDLIQIKSKVKSAIDTLAPELIEISRYLHANPELNFQEHKAVKLLTSFLTEKGFKVEKGIANLSTAFRAEFEVNASPSIALLAEYDALPEIGHACGHNLIAAGSVGAAVGIAQACPDLPGKISIIGAPAEEGGGGKILLAKAGVFNGIDAAMMAHPNSKTEITKCALAMTSLKASFKGKTAHAAADPHQGINALDAVILSFNAIGALRQQIRPDARIHGIITDGGQAPNIIPEHAAAAFYVRSLDMDYLNELLEKVKNCLRGAAQSAGATVKIEVDELVYAPFKLNYCFSDLFQKNLESLGIKVDEYDEAEGIGSTDVGNVSQIAPTIHPYIAICKRDISAHSARFAEVCASEQGQQKMLVAAKTLAMTAIDLLYQPDTFKKITDEFKT